MRVNVTCLTMNKIKSYKFKKKKKEKKKSDVTK